MAKRDQLEKENIPQCVGIIMDGNRRWAKKRGLPTIEGHRRGYKKLKEIALLCKKMNIRNIIVYAFSTENWNRNKEEIDYLMNLFRILIFKEMEWLKKENIRVKFVGQIERLALDIQKGIKDIEKETEKGLHTLYIAISYGGRAEILSAVKKIVREKTPKEIESMEEQDFSQYLWTGDMPDPDLIIRTSGEKRLSNFLPWQATYSELFFPKVCWPSFTKKEFLEIVEIYKERKRRKGG